MKHLTSIISAVFSGLIFVGSALAGNAGGIFDITDFGARGDGKTVNTEAIKKAFEACEKRGGGTVSVPPGVFVTGTIFMKSHTELHLEPGAVLKASPNRNDYCKIDAYPQNGESFNEKWSGGHLLVAVNVENISLTGPGVIDGSGDAFLPKDHGKPTWAGYGWRHGFARNEVKYKGDDPEMIRKELRPGQLLVFCECNDVRIANISIKNSPCWCCFLHGCRDVFVNAVKIDNPFYYANADGIDIDCCQHVLVSNCRILTGDDSFAIRGNPKRLLDKTKVCENIVITNCVCASGSCAFRIGVGEGTICDVLVSNIRILECSTAIFFQSAYNRKAPKGVSISRVRFSGMNIQNTAFAFQMTPGIKEASAKIEDIVIDGIRAEAFAGADVECNDNTAPGNIIVRNSEFIVTKHPDNIKRTLDTYFRLEGARNMTMENVSLRWEDPILWKKAIIENEKHKIKKINCDLPDPPAANK